MLDYEVRFHVKTLIVIVIATIVMVITSYASNVQFERIKIKVFDLSKQLNHLSIVGERNTILETRVDKLEERQKYFEERYINNTR
jgi:hypothetical protein